MSLKMPVFIRKGTGRPFTSDVLDDGRLAKGALPGFNPGITGFYPTKVSLLVRTAPDAQARTLLNERTFVHWWIVAGLDAQGRPSFLTMEDADEPGWNVNLGRETFDVEAQVRACPTLEQSAAFAEDYVREHRVAQWSLVEAPSRRGLRRTPAIYELSATYYLATYRSDGKLHLCLGQRVDDLVGVA